MPKKKKVQKSDQDFESSAKPLKPTNIGCFFIFFIILCARRKPDATSISPAHSIVRKEKRKVNAYIWPLPHLFQITRPNSPTSSPLVKKVTQKRSPHPFFFASEHLLFGDGRSTATLRDITFNQAWKLNAAKAKKKNRSGLS